MHLKKQLRFGAGMLLLALIVCVAAFSSAAAPTALPVALPVAEPAGITPEQLDAMALDPQSWLLQRDMTWSDFLPNPVVDWKQELNPDGLFNPTPMSYGQQKKINGGLVLVDYLDRRFISGQPAGSDVLGYLMYKQDGSGYDLAGGVKNNPIKSILDFTDRYPNGYNELGKFWRDYLNDPTFTILNHGVNIDEYWREVTYGKWGVDLTPYGVYTLPYFEFELQGTYMNSFKTYREIPPSFRFFTPNIATFSPGVNGSGNARSTSLDPHATEVARMGAADAPGNIYGLPQGMPGLYRFEPAPFKDFDFFFFLHAGYCSSGSWQAFGQLQFETRQDVTTHLSPGDVPDLGPYGRLKMVEDFFNEYPEWIPIYAERYKDGWANYTGDWNAIRYNSADATAVENITTVYRETEFWNETLASYEAWLDWVDEEYDGDDEAARDAWDADYATWETDYAAWLSGYTTWKTTTWDPWKTKKDVHDVWQDKKDAHDAWQTIKDAHDAWQIIKDAHDAWQVKKDAYEAWVAGGNIGPEPEQPGVEPEQPGIEPEQSGTEPDPPGAEPEQPGAEPVYGTPEPVEPPAPFVFALPQEDWDWADSYHAAKDYVGREHYKNTRYVPFTSWEGSVGEWSHQSNRPVGSGFGQVGLLPPGDTRTRIEYSTQGENSGMATFAHEFGHVAGWPDNYGSPWANAYSCDTENWDIMSRGSFAGPFGDLARWAAPGIEAGTVPVHPTFGLKSRGAGSPAKSFYDDGNVLEIDIEALAGGTPAVANIVSRNVPLDTKFNDFGVPQLDSDSGNGFVKAIQLNFGAGAWADQAVLKATGITGTRQRAVRMGVEVVDQSGYDSYTHDSGVLISRVSNATNGARQVVDSHLYNIDMTDFFLGGADPNDSSVGAANASRYVLAHATQQADALFKVGKSFSDTGYYGSLRNAAGAVTVSGSVRKGEAANGRPIVSGDTVNEWRDEANKLHFYILQKHLNEVKTHGAAGHYEHQPFLSYTVAVRHDEGKPVGGKIELAATAFVPASEGNYATQTFSLKNTGAETDIVRISLEGTLAEGRFITIDAPWEGSLPPSINEDGLSVTFDPSGRDMTVPRIVPIPFSEQNAAILNDLYAIGPDQTITFNVYIKAVAGDLATFPARDLGVIATSETNAAKVAVFGALKRPADADVVKQFIVDDPHHGEYCTEDAQTVREFGPGTTYGPIITNGIEDPLFKKGGFLFGPTDKEKLKIYAIAVDFPDVSGDMQITHGRHRNMVKAPAYGGTVIDFSDPQIHFDYLFGGSDALKKNEKVEWKGSLAQEYKGIQRVLSEMSMGRLDVEIELLNERYAEAMGIDTTQVRTPWFHLDEPIFGYSTAGPADCEDYHQFVRLFQAAMNVADKELKAAGLDGSVEGKGANFEDIGFIYVLTPFNAFGYRLGFQGGGGIMAAYSVNEQALSLRDSEYRHVPGALTPGGRMVGSGSFGMKGPFNMASTNPAASAVVTQSHELIHGLGFFDDYAYGYMGDANNKYFVSNIGESPHSGANRWGTMDQYSDLRTVTPDPPIWRKFRMGWIYDDEIELVLPGGAPQTIYLRASGSAPGIDGGSYTNDASVKTRMVVIPKEYRTRDTFGLEWTNLWNPHGAHYDWYEWFVNLWVGGETYAMKSFPTFYTLESRKALGADGKPLGYYSGLPSTRDGVVVSYIANPTWETGHGAGGFKIMSGDYGLNANPGRTTTWIDPHIGLTITVKESTAFYDKVEVAYTGVATTEAKHVYQGLLTASENFVTADNDFTVDFSLATLGTPAIDDHGLTTERSVGSGGLQGTTPMTSYDPAPPLPTAVKRVATPLGVPGGISGFTMEVSFDAANFEYVSTGAAPFAYTVDTAAAATGKLIVSGSGTEMVDKDTILSLNFKAKAGAVVGDYTVAGRITDVTLRNWRGEPLVKGDPGFDGVGTFGNGTLAALYNTVANNTLTYEDIRSSGGKVTVGAAVTYTVSGSIVCDTKGPAAGEDINIPGAWIGIESVVTIYNSAGAVLGTAKSDWDGNYSIQGIPAGSGYYLKAAKPKYEDFQTAPFEVSGNIADKNVQLKRALYPISGTIYGAVNSDGSGKIPLAGVDVYVVSIGNAYRVIGGPATTDAEGKYTVYATTDSETKAFTGLAVKAEGNAAKYGTQLTVFAKDSLTGQYAGLRPGEDLHLNMGTQPHLILDDWVYPANNVRLGQPGTFAFYLGGATSQAVTGRDLTLTETQDVHIRTVTKSNTIYYQLRKLSDGSAVGPQVRSLGASNGDDLIRNVPLGQYYIELTREGYVSVNSMPFSVGTTRVLLRDGQTTNTLDINTRLGANVVSGKVVDSVSGKALGGVSIVFQSWSYTGGNGNPITSAADGTFRYDVLADDKDIIFSKEGYYPTTINIPSGGGAANRTVELKPIPNFYLNLKSAQTALQAGDTLLVDVILDGDRNYTQVNTSITFDADLLLFAGYANLSGIAAEVKKDGADKIAIRSVPALNMLQGAPCVNPVRVVTLKFTVKEASESETAISFVAGLATPTAGASTITATGKPLTIQLTIDN